MPSLILKMPFGEVKIDFADNKDLQEQLAKIDFEALAKTVGDKVPSIMTEQRKVREEIADLIDTDGKFMIFKNTPKMKIDMVILSIYAYGTSATIEEIRHTTGISDPSGDAINSGSSRKYFITIDKQKQTYGLSTDGLQRVTTEIIPELRGQKKVEPSKKKGG